MAGTFIIGETKIRPGTYFNIQKVGGNQLAGADDGGQQGGLDRGDIAQQTGIVQYAIKTRVVDANLLCQLLALLRRAG